ncbi:MAG TPA: hypothetical protein VFE46_05985 [Pirellulales bacterium]|jgi:hypothetical protein|nr:hypothetical protein [Pirellulales bacterium]
MQTDTAVSRFHPYRSKGWPPVIFGLMTLILGILLAWGITGENKQPFNLARSSALAMLVFLDPLTWFSLWLMSLGIGIWRAHVAIREDGLEMYAHRFSMWSIRRMRRVRLAWNEVAGIQPFALTNMLAPGGVQEEFVLYTAAGKFILPGMLWPDAQQIATQISNHMGKAIGDLSAVQEPIVGRRPSDRRGARIMHGIGWFAQAAGWVFAAISLVAIFGGANFRSMIYMIMLSMMLVLSGSSLRRFRMG